MTNYWRLWRTWQRLKTFQYTDLKSTKAFQFKRFKKLIHHAYNRIPMYREFYESHGFQPLKIRNYEDIANVPIITKDIIRRYPIIKRIDNSLLKKDVHKERTSGSTGEPLEIWQERTESLIQSIKIIRALREWGYSPFFRTIRLWGGDDKLKQSILQKFGLFRKSDIAILGNSETAVNEVLKSKCDVIVAMRSSLEAFADELDKRNISFKPQIIYSTGEMLRQEHYHRFREVFGCSTLNVYGAVEIGNIAWECPEQPHNLHVDMETVLINFHDVKSQSNGHVGSVILTNLESFLMPFIRYDQGDRVIIPDNDECACGRTLPVLGKVYGRNDDIISYEGRNYYWNFFYNYMTKFLYIKKYKIVQTKKGHVEFRILLYQNNEETRNKCISDLTSAYKDHFAPLKIRFVDEFPLEPNRKFKVLEKET